MSHRTETYDKPIRTTYEDTLRSRHRELRDAAERRDRGEPLNLSIPTGLRAWDDNGGIERGVLSVIGAATGDGKSVVKLHLATAAAKAGLRVLMMDFEDPSERTADRTFSTETGLDSKEIGKVNLDAMEMEQIGMAVEASVEWARRIDHHVGLVDTREALRLMGAGKVGGGEGDTPLSSPEHWDLILIDYAQCFPDVDDDGLTKVIGDFAAAANLMAQRLKCAVVLFSQLNVHVEERGLKKFDEARYRDPSACYVDGYCPTSKRDIAWASALGERCKRLYFLFRPGRIARTLTGKMSIPDNKMKIIAVKANFATQADMVFYFDGATATLRDWDK